MLYSVWIVAVVYSIAQEQEHCEVPSDSLLLAWISQSWGVFSRHRVCWMAWALYCCSPSTPALRMELHTLPSLHSNQTLAVVAESSCLVILCSRLLLLYVIICNAQFSESTQGVNLFTLTNPYPNLSSPHPVKSNTTNFVWKLLISIWPSSICLPVSGSAGDACLCCWW